MAIPTPSSNSRRNLWIGLGALAGILICLCLVVGIVGGIILYLRQNQPTSAAGPAVEYILDASPRMALPSQTTGTRLMVARGVLAEVIRPADPSVIAGLRVFGTGANTQACQDTRLLVPLGLSTQKLISQEASNLDTGQSTDSALAQAMIAAIRDLATKTGAHSLVVVTGGADSCNPEASQVVAQEAERAGIDLEIFVIGFEVSDTEAQAIKVVLEQTPDAQYLDAPDEESLRVILRGIQDRIDNPATAYVKQSACDYPYFPLRQGASWQYTTEGQTYNETVTAVTGDLDNATASMEFDLGGATMSFDWTCGPEGLTSSQLTDFQASGLQGNNVQMQTTEHSGVILLPPDKLMPGSTWDSHYTQEINMEQMGQSITMNYEMSEKYTVAGVESITTSAGTFDAIRVDSTGTVTVSGLPVGGPTEIQTSKTQWLVRGVGLVRTTSTTGTSSSTQELTSYSIP